ncbi:MAG: hypothetical protein CMH83_20030 [Nocardioides sp.]|nr:hypothetical protein [Nocardioides sp.]
MRAAECWIVDGELAAERLEAARVRGLWLAKRAEDEQRTRRSDQHRETWHRWPDPAIDAEVADDWLQWIGGVA